MTTKGTGLLMVWADVPADREDEFNRWYHEEHVHPKVSESAAWLAQRDVPPVTQRIRPHMRHAAGSPGIWVKTFEIR